MKTRDIRNEDWRAPQVPDGEVLLFDEPGRVLDLKSDGGNFDVCYSAYHFRVTKRHGIATLRVRHGGGEESWRLGGAMDRALAEMDSDTRFFALHAIMDAHHEAWKRACEYMSNQYRQAFVDGRLKKRKLRGQAAVKVWIESARATP